MVWMNRSSDEIGERKSEEEWLESFTVEISFPDATCSTNKVTPNSDGVGREIAESV